MAEEMPMFLGLSVSFEAPGDANSSSSVWAGPRPCISDADTAVPRMHWVVGFLVRNSQS